MICDYCGQEADVLVAFEDGVGVCLPCRAKEKERIAEEFRKVYGPDFDQLATYQAEGR